MIYIYDIKIIKQEKKREFYYNYVYISEIYEKKFDEPKVYRIIYSISHIKKEIDFTFFNLSRKIFSRAILSNDRLIKK